MNGNSDGIAAPQEMKALELELELLREDNARLRMAQHRPPDVGRLIDQLRLVAGERGQSELEDEVWSLLGQLLAMREGLEQVCSEIEATTSAVRARLQGLSVDLDAVGLMEEFEDGAAPRN